MRMFAEVTKTWNPVVGCLHNCTYCWARKLAEGRLRHLPPYCFTGFAPKLITYRLKEHFKSGLIFVSTMGDLWGEWIGRDTIEAVLDTVKESPFATFLFLTKNPGRYLTFAGLPLNAIAGATIETNHSYIWMRAPSPQARYEAMRRLKHPLKMLSIEPILDFDLDIMEQWVKDIAPAFIYIGYDNYGNNLPEPSLKKTKQLITALKKFTSVRIKSLREGMPLQEPAQAAGETGIK